MDPVDEPLGGYDVSTTPTVEDFDLDEWLAGARPTRRAVSVHVRGDLVATLEELILQIEATDDPDEIEALEAEAEQVQAAFAASRRTFVVEARSSEWTTAFKAEIAKQRGLKLEGKTARPDDVLAFSLAMLAQQIVVPSGVTEAHIHRLAEVAEPEVMRLLDAQQAANSLAASRVGVVTRDFSHGRSGHATV